jgi:CO/xanthine dehydrogenase Mo-binding subunit
MADQNDGGPARLAARPQDAQGEGRFRTDLPMGEGMGVAVVESHGTIAAACATVTVSCRGRLEVEKVLVVMDVGRVINPHAAAEQCEGSVCWELSHAWTGGYQLRCQNGKPRHSRWRGFPKAAQGLARLEPHVRR